MDGKPSLYGKHPNHPDILYSFSSPLVTVPGPTKGESTPTCKTCAQQKAEGALSKGQIILTNALLRDATDANNSALHSLELNEVKRYLKEHLHWKAVDVGVFFFSPSAPPSFILHFKLSFFFGKKNPLGVIVCFEKEWGMGNS